jgi:2-iminobutanoate/2-iminopropanoate deaminase
MAMQEIVEVPGIRAIGPYSQAVRANGFLFVSGQPGLVPETGEVPVADAGCSAFAAQARQAFENLRRVLEAGGSGMDRVVNTTVLVADISEFGVVNELFAEYFAASPPARMTMNVPLPKRLLFSIGCVAVVG